MYKPRKKIFSPQKTPRNYSKYFIVLSLILVIVLIVMMKPWGSQPQVSLQNLNKSHEDTYWINAQDKLVFKIPVNKSGICEVLVNLKQNDQVFELYSEEHSFQFFPETNPEKAIALNEAIKKLQKLGSIREEKALLEVKVADCSLLGRKVQENFQFQFDWTPPSVTLHGSPYYFTQGGAGLITYSIDEKEVTSEIIVGEDVFPGYQNPYQADEFFSLFVFSYRHPADTPVKIRATDQAGNEITTQLSGIFVKSQQFRTRRINISDQFIQTKVKDIISKTPHINWSSDNKTNFIAVNAKLRSENAKFFEDISKQSVKDLLWEDVFIPQPNMEVMAYYADHRNYYYQDTQIDKQVHLGYDMASIRGAEIVASANGKVLFADYLGIYGNTVIIDHGYGLITVYAHLSKIIASAGQSIKKGDLLGNSGETGLAGGDHLHFSVLIHGVQTNPKEFWDKKWTQTHIFNRLKSN